MANLPEYLKKMSLEDRWNELERLDNARMDDEDAMEAELEKLGFEDREHFEDLYREVRDEMNPVSEEQLDATNAFLAQQQAQMNAMMGANINAAKAGGLLNPIEGVDLETWAAANAKLGSGMDMKDILKIVGVEQPVWDKVSADWMARMQQDTSFAIAKVYGDAFTNPNMGKFASAGGATSGASSPAVEKVMNDFEQFVKITCHQSAGAAQGKDANAILKEYGLSGADWGKIGSHWAPKMAVDVRMAADYTKFSDKYMAMFSSGSVADEVKF